MKKALLLLLVFALLLSGSAFAAEYTGTVNPEAVLLLNADTNERLYEKNATALIYPASTTKILTALVVLGLCENLDELVTVATEDIEGIHEGDDSTLVPMLKAGEQISVRDLLYGLMLVSGNDAAAVLARHISGSEEAFVAAMNETAFALGMENSHFTNPHGVHNEDHRSTAEDMAKLAQAALKNPEFMEIVSCAAYSNSPTNMTGAREYLNSNLFLNEKPELPGTEYQFVTGMKTGYTPMAGGCLVSTAERNGAKLICLVFGDDSEEQQERWFLSKELFEYGFNYYENPESTVSMIAGEAALESGEEILPQSEAMPAESMDEDFPAQVGSAQNSETPFEVPQAAEVLSSAVDDDGMIPEAPTEKNKGGRALWVILAILSAILALGLLLVLYLRLENIRRHRQRMQKKGLRPRPSNPTPTVMLAAAILFFALFMVFSMSRCSKAGRMAENAPDIPVATPEPPKGFAPEMTADTNPANWGVQWEILGQTDGRDMSFGEGNDYFKLPGLAGFRGDNYRQGASYGTVSSVESEYVSVLWETGTSALPDADGSSSWTGSGWTGQPLIVQWDDATRNIMNLRADKKAKAGLVEVIYATLDGHIYFLDIDDGSYTRDPINVGMAFKGSGALDPRGYPLMYVGSGDETVDGKRPRMFIISLIDGQILYEYGDAESFSLRQDNHQWCAFDASPLVHAETDTLLWPGESGVLYRIKLNTSYDPVTGTISVAPDEPVKVRYNTSRSGEDKYWYGMEASPVIVDHYMYVSENGGMFFCIDLNTMELVWAQDTGDDSNSSPVYEPVDEEHGYIYTAPSLHWTADSGGWGSICIYKLDAITGEVIWSRRVECGTVEGVSGGVQSSPLLGKEGTDIEGMIFYPVARTPDMGRGLFIAYDTENGSEIWRLSMDSYTWSSPVAVYTPEGKAYIVLCDSSGYARLIDGATGEVLDTTSLGSLIEASPAAFNEKLVVGTRGQKIFGLHVY